MAFRAVASGVAAITVSVLAVYKCVSAPGPDATTTTATAITMSNASRSSFPVCPSSSSWFSASRVAHCDDGHSGGFAPSMPGGVPSSAPALFFGGFGAFAAAAANVDKEEEERKTPATAAVLLDCCRCLDTAIAETAAKRGTTAGAAVESAWSVESTDFSSVSSVESMTKKGSAALQLMRVNQVYTPSAQRVVDTNTKDKSTATAVAGGDGVGVVKATPPPPVVVVEDPGNPAPLMRLVGFFPGATPAQVYTELMDVPLRYQWDSNYMIFEEFADPTASSTHDRNTSNNSSNVSTMIAVRTAGGASGGSGEPHSLSGYPGGSVSGAESVNWIPPSARPMADSGGGSSDGPFPPLPPPLPVKSSRAFSLALPDIVSRYARAWGTHPVCAGDLCTMVPNASVTPIDQGWLCHKVGSALITKFGFVPRFFVYERVGFMHRLPLSSEEETTGTRSGNGGGGDAPHVQQESDSDMSSISTATTTSSNSFLNRCVAYSIVYAGSRQGQTEAGRDLPPLADWISRNKRTIHAREHNKPIAKGEVPVGASAKELKAVVVPSDMNMQHILLIPITDFRQQLLSGGRAKAAVGSSAGGPMSPVFDALTHTGSMFAPALYKSVVALMRESADLAVSRHHQQLGKKGDGKGPSSAVLTAAHSNNDSSAAVQRAYEAGGGGTLVVLTSANDISVPAGIPMFVQRRVSSVLSHQAYQEVSESLTKDFSVNKK